MRALQIASLTLFLPSLLPAQVTNVHASVTKALDGMNAPTWTLREKAFRDMPDLIDVSEISAREADRLKVGVISLLNTENAAEEEFKRSGTTFSTEEHSEYYASLIIAVANLHDERAIPALVGAINTGGIAMRGVARFGDKAIDPLLSLLNTGPDPKSLTRSSALFAIRDMLWMRVPITDASHARIKRALESALKDPEFGVRWAAISAIEYMNDRQDFVPALKDIAAHDPGEITPAEHYTLRRPAEQLLRKIASGQPPPDAPSILK